MTQNWARIGGQRRFDESSYETAAPLYTASCTGHKLFSLVAVPISIGAFGDIAGLKTRSCRIFPSIVYFSACCGALLRHRCDSGGEMDSIVIARKRQKGLLQEVLNLAVRELDMLEADRLEDVERLLLLRAERMGEFEMAEVNVNATMPGIDNNVFNPEELAELHDLNLQMMRLANCIVAIDEWAQELVELRDFRFEVEA
jgi:hypothetical protein